MMGAQVSKDQYAFGVRQAAMAMLQSGQLTKCYMRVLWISRYSWGFVQRSA
jgi:hypothetical protein